MVLEAAQDRHRAEEEMAPYSCRREKPSMGVEGTRSEAPCSARRTRVAGLALREATEKRVVTARADSVAEDLIALNLILLLLMSQIASSRISIKPLPVGQDKYNGPGYSWQDRNAVSRAVPCNSLPGLHPQVPA